MVDLPAPMGPTRKMLFNRFMDRYFLVEDLGVQALGGHQTRLLTRFHLLLQNARGDEDEQFLIGFLTGIILEEIAQDR